MNLEFNFRDRPFIDELRAAERARHFKELHDAKERAIHRKDWKAADRILKTLRTLSK